jgi:hypothetical protein
VSHDEYAVEPIPGLPEEPPRGEVILWQGRPQWWPTARRAFQINTVAVYFLLLGAWGVRSGLGEGLTWAEAVQHSLGILVPALLGLSLLAALAYGYARMTVYTLTTSRLVIRSGIALPTTVNIPFAQVQSAGLKTYADGSGDIPLQLLPEQSVSRLVLWPHVRPWHWRKVQPMLRGIAEPQRVAELLGTALRAKLHEDVAAPASQWSPAPMAQPHSTAVSMRA